MITFKKILFPVDFSQRCTAAVPSVQAMVRRFDSELTVLHVVDLPATVGIAPPEAAAWATLIGADRLRENGRIALSRFVAREFRGVEVKAESTEGDPATMIVDYARDTAADLIMMPTSGVGRFRRMLLGSVTAKVLHDIAVPVPAIFRHFVGLPSFRKSKSWIYGWYTPSSALTDVKTIPRCVNFSLATLTSASTNCRRRPEHISKRACTPAKLAMSSV
jgi:nucleotide-binding universal stress UspA family protein